MIKKQLFIWQGVNREKVALKGQIEAVNAATAKTSLHQQGIRIRKLSRKWFSFTVLIKKSIKFTELAIFSRQLASLVSASVPLIQALNIIIKSSTNKQLQTLLISLRNDIQTGIKFCDAAGNYPQYFTNFFCSLVRVGEETGSLAKVLNAIANNQEKNVALKRKISKALCYPAIIMLVASAVLAILLFSVVPQFKALYATFNAKLPIFTLFVINLATSISQHICTILVSFFMLGSLFFLAKCYSKSFNKLLAKLILNLPIIGNLIRQTIVARFSSMLAITFTAGMPIVEALKIVAKTAGNSVYENKILMVRDAVSTGCALHIAIKETNLFSPMVTQMISIGEETGKLDEMLNKIASMYTEEVDTMVAELSNLIEPFIILIVSVLVGSVVIAMYLPIFKLGNII